jgi:hypothetical protein
MAQETAIKVFQQKQVRSNWNTDEEKWYFSIVDVVGILTDSPNPNNYWKVLKHRLTKEGSELVTNCNQLKMQSSDGKYYKTDVADTEQMFRLIQSVPSPNAEPFKQWLAQVGRERIDEIEDPEKGIDRMMGTYLRKGYSKEWINQRLKSIEIRKELTDEWEERGMKRGKEYAINAIRVNDFVLLPADYPITADKLRREGLKLIELPMSEFRKLDGGLSCLSLRW